MLAPTSHGFLLFVKEFGALVGQMLAFCHSAHLFPSVFLGCLTSVIVQAQVALVICALDCDHAQPRTGHQIWSQASKVKSQVVLVPFSTDKEDAQSEILKLQRRSGCKGSDGRAGGRTSAAQRSPAAPNLAPHTSHFSVRYSTLSD